MSSPMGNMLRGAIAGGVATWLMDLVTTGLLQGHPPEVTAREEAARPNGKSAVANLVDRLDTEIGLELDDGAKNRAASAIHFGLGIVPGALYAVLRRLPLIGRGRGLVYGALLWLVNDEYLNSRLGLAAPPESYPVETHTRGLIGHLALGVATDTGIDILGG